MASEQASKQAVPLSTSEPGLEGLGQLKFSIDPDYGAGDEGNHILSFLWSCPSLFRSCLSFESA